MGFTERDLFNNQLPLRVVERRGEATYSRSTSGKRGVGYTSARGPVVFINSSPNPVLVPKGVIVATEAGQRYVTTANVMVPGKTTRYEVGVATGEEYGRAEVEVEALEKGTGGNVEAKTIVRIEGPLARSLQVINLQRFTSGEDRWVAVVDEKDYLRAKEEAERQMKFQVEEDLREMRKKEDYVLLQELVFTETERIEADPPVGAEGGPAPQTHLPVTGGNPEYILTVQMVTPLPAADDSGSFAQHGEDHHPRPAGSWPRLAAFSYISMRRRKSGARSTGNNSSGHCRENLGRSPDGIDRFPRLAR